jgi:hypothetical protein
MVDPLKTDLRLVGSSDAPRAAQQVSGEPDIAFRALLERLRAGADQLAHSSEEASDAKTLSHAVGDAQTSLRDALSLSERLLEAYRADAARRNSA